VHALTVFGERAMLAFDAPLRWTARARPVALLRHSSCPSLLGCDSLLPDDVLHQSHRRRMNSPIRSSSREAT